MTLHQISQPTFFQVLQHILLELENHSGSAGEWLGRVIVRGHGKRPPCTRFPTMGRVVIVLGHYCDGIGNQVCTVKPNTKLTNHTHIGTGFQRLHKRLGPRLGNGSQMVNQIGLGHSNPTVFNRERAVGGIRNELDVQLWIGFQYRTVRQRLVPNLVQGIGCIGNQFTKENVLVGIERVDDE